MRILAWAWFWVVQLITFVAMVIGWFLLIPLAGFNLWKLKTNDEFPGRELCQWCGGWLTFIWGNLEDGVIGTPLYRQKHPGVRWCAYLWSGWRNSANNLRFVFRWRGGPFHRIEWLQPVPTFHKALKFVTFEKARFYFQCGWYPNGFPVISAGRIDAEPQA